MTKKKLIEQRIVVTVDTSARAEPALALAAMLAKAQRRALHGLFIEDTDLLSVAGLPFTREYPRAGGPSHNFDNRTLERQMARLSEQYRGDLERMAKAAAVPWSYASVRTNKRLVMGAAEASAGLLVIGQPAPTATRPDRILLLNGNRAGVLRTLASVLAAPGHGSGDLMVYGDFDPEALNAVLAQHPQVTRRLMGGPSLKELLTGSHYRPSLVLLSREADAAELEPCLRLADCPVIVVSEDQ